jgi:hypothetical protein
MSNDEIVMKRLKVAAHLDSAGMAISVICAIHCVILPLAVGVLPASGLAWVQSEAYEPVIVGSSLVIGIFSLLPAYRRVHRNHNCLALFVLGIASILIGMLGQNRWTPEAPFVVGGAVMIVLAHAANYQLCKRCRGCSTTSC